jgi:hypothetical protein
MDGSDRTEILLFVTSKGLDAGVCENALVGRVDDFYLEVSRATDNTYELRKERTAYAFCKGVTQIERRGRRW